jgi:hypothetical protein
MLGSGERFDGLERSCLKRRRSGIPIQESVRMELHELGSELGLVLER